MRTFLLDIIPRLQRFSKKLDSSTILTKKHWVLLTEEPNKKVVYIFRENANQLIIAENGKVKKGTWEQIGSNSLVLDIDSESLLFKQGFLDDQVLALKKDGTDEYALLVDEIYFDKTINSLSTLHLFLEHTYLSQPQARNISKSHEAISFTISPAQYFNYHDFPSLRVELDSLKKELKNYPKDNAADIIVSFAKNHSLKNECFDKNKELSNAIVNQELKIGTIEALFKACERNKHFESEYQNYLLTELKSNY